MAGERDEEILNVTKSTIWLFFLRKHLLDRLYSILHPVVRATVEITVTYARFTKRHCLPVRQGVDARMSGSIEMLTHVRRSTLRRWVTAFR